MAHQRTGADVTELVWRKSTHSTGNGGQCVEVAENVPGVIAVRDSKNPGGPVLMFGTTEWAAFVLGVKHGQFGT